MSPQEINMAIAEACGWKLDEPTGDCEPPYWKHPKEGGTYEPPNYCGDLNAMHGAEQSLGDYWPTYLRSLWCICNPNQKECCVTHVQNFLTKRIVMASAAQRAEAFLRTIGKWVEAYADELDRLGHGDVSTCSWRLKASDIRAARAALAQGKDL